MAEIETIYRARIDYETTADARGWPDDDPVDKVGDFALRVCDKADIECEAFGGNACCSPYITLESRSWGGLENAVGKIERYIRKFTRQLKLTE